MTERSYLSIGDVLGLLREEYPDITISKIRFLESRGLLVPERTPSGYRKFYDHDVDRLRWILRQQREHFLPLKVIKGRLEGGESSESPALFPVDRGDPPPSEESPSDAEETEPASSARAPDVRREPAMARVNGRHEDPERGGVLATAAGGRGTPGSEADQNGAAPAGRPVSASAAAPSSSAGTARAGGGAAGRPPPGEGATTPPRASAGASPPAGPPARPSAAPPASPGRTGDAEVQQRQAAPASAPARHAEQAEARAASSPGAGGGEPPDDREAADEPASALAGASLTVAELAHASGLDIAQIEQLESFGLIDGRTLAGVHCFDEEALVVASLAARFAAFGVEARHLRQFKHAAERQSGLYSQVVLPLLRQRNPEARRRALDDLAKLAELGSSLQGCFARSLMRDLTGG